MCTHSYTITFRNLWYIPQMDEARNEFVLLYLRHFLWFKSKLTLHDILI